MNLNSIVLSNLRPLFLSSLSACYLKKLAITGNYWRAMSSLLLNQIYMLPIHTLRVASVEALNHLFSAKRHTIFKFNELLVLRFLFFLYHSRDETITDDNLQALKRVRKVTAPPHT